MSPARDLPRLVAGLAIVGLALLPLLMIAPGYPRLAVLPDVGRLDDVDEANDPPPAKLPNDTVDSPPHPDPLPRGSIMHELSAVSGWQREHRLHG